MACVCVCVMIFLPEEFLPMETKPILLDLK